MSVRYVSQDEDLQWSDEMKSLVQKKIVSGLKTALKSAKFEFSVGLNRPRMSRGATELFEIWGVLQTFDGRGNQVVRLQGDSFHDLVQRVAKEIHSRLTSQPSRSSHLFSTNPFQLMAFDQTA
jgi:hypothetical protein